MSLASSRPVDHHSQEIWRQIAEDRRIYQRVCTCQKQRHSGKKFVKYTAHWVVSGGGFGVAAGKEGEAIVNEVPPLERTFLADSLIPYGAARDQTTPTPISTKFIIQKPGNSFESECR